MNEYIFTIAGIKICIKSEKEISYSREMLPFLTETETEYEYEYCVETEKENEIENTEKHAEKLNSYIFRDGEKIYRKMFSFHNGKRIPLMLCRGSDIGRYQLILPGCMGNCKVLFERGRIAPYLAIEEILLKEEAFILHASFISWHGSGILFTAPSGTGKSTQAELWRRFRGAEIINGDRAVIRKQGESYIAYGSPYAGSSNIHKNESAPLKAIVMLSQGKENRIGASRKKESYIRLLKETLVNSWNPEFMKKMMELLWEVVEDIPIYDFSCRPDESAVETAEKILFEKEDGE